MSAKKIRRSPRNGTDHAETTVFPSFRSKSRPLLALSLALLLALLLLALCDYQRDQVFYFHDGFLGALAMTTELSASNAMGLLGATVAILFFNLAGLGTFFLPLCMGVAAWCTLFYRAHTLYPWRLTLMAVGFLSLVTLLAMLDCGPEGIGGTLAVFHLQDFVPKGAGGTIGHFLHHRLIRDVFGETGTVIIFSLIHAFCLLGIFVDKPAQYIAGRIHRLRQRMENWRETRNRQAEELREFRRQRAEAIAKGQTRSQPVGVVEADGTGAVAATDAPQTDAGDGTDDDSPQFADGTDGAAGAVAESAEPSPEDAQAGAVVLSLDEGVASSGRRKGRGVAAADKLTILGEERVERSTSSLAPKRKGDYQFPPVGLLKEPPPVEAAPQENYSERAQKLVTTLGEFKIKVEMGDIQTGPVITRYEVVPAPGVRVEKISGLANNIAMNLKAESVRVLAPVPGKGTVGIEVPNNKPKAVSLREIIESRAWEENKCEIPIVLGKDVTGKPMITDLARMPHCLIAGSTGSGKSVCINGIVASLVYHAGPDDIRFIMVDPKVVELQVYNKLPHMLIPVVTEAKKVPGALKWLISEMERRYQIFAKTGVRNIAGFNAKISKDRVEAERARQMDLELSAEERSATAQVEVPRDDDALDIPDKKLPYIVCFIDELADLMMVAPADIETAIARLAQLARAAGIHLILATQRPSVNVITGIIKANLPCRIAFKVTSLIDSRTILDQKGAETLIGRGDMLFIPPGSSHLVRAQGAFVSEEEITDLVEHIALCNGEPDFDDSVQQTIELEALGDDEDNTPTEGTDDPNEDPMIAKSWEVIRATKRASTSNLQRKLSIGYNRAARIMDILEERGYIGPDQGPGNPREILRES